MFLPTNILKTKCQRFGELSIGRGWTPNKKEQRKQKERRKKSTYVYYKVYACLAVIATCTLGRMSGIFYVLLR